MGVRRMGVLEGWGWAAGAGRWSVSLSKGFRFSNGRRAAGRAALEPGRLPGARRDGPGKGQPRPVTPYLRRHV
ncbi:hypothetical protein MTP06_46970 [Streptomyces sp. PLM4]|nr:hypothetical protein MTP06_46970 [Streptomyces sp. PLM4]